MSLPEWPPLLGQRVEIISENDCQHHPRIKYPTGVDPLTVRMFGRVMRINTRREQPLTDHPYWIETDDGPHGYVSLDEMEPFDANDPTARQW